MNVGFPVVVRRTRCDVSTFFYFNDPRRIPGIWRREPIPHASLCGGEGVPMENVSALNAEREEEILAGTSMYVCVICI